MALVNGGTIPDTGQYAAYTSNGMRIGELDEEFIYERRVGDAFLLGTNAWRLERIEADRVIVSPGRRSAGHGARSGAAKAAAAAYDLGLAIGAFLRELAERASTPPMCSTGCSANSFSMPTRPAISVIMSSGSCSPPAACRRIARC